MQLRQTVAALEVISNQLHFQRVITGPQLSSRAANLLLWLLTISIAAAAAVQKDRAAAVAGPTPGLFC
jgi:hypothetical protein